MNTQEKLDALTLYFGKGNMLEELVSALATSQIEGVIGCIVTKNDLSFDDEDNESEDKMDGYDMMCNLTDYLGEWAVLDALARYLPNDDLVKAMESIARDYDYSFDGE